MPRRHHPGITTTTNTISAGNLPWNCLHPPPPTHPPPHNTRTFAYSLNSQGWPKMAMYVILTTQDGGVAVGLFAPAAATLPDGSTIAVQTDYPFDDVVTVVLNAKAAMPLYMRVPAWAINATMTVQGVAQASGCAEGSCMCMPVSLLM